MITHHCEECRAVLDPAKILRCTKCKACFYCSKACQTRNWRRLHKRVCTTDPLLRPFIRVEMAIERVLKKLPKMDEAPKDARCYICLGGDDDGSSSSKLTRGCACRGESAGFVHVECLAAYAESKEGGDVKSIIDGWSTCVNCKQMRTGGLELAIRKLFWRRYRSDRQRQELRYHSTKSLADGLLTHDEIDAASHLYEEASTGDLPTTRKLHLERTLQRARILSRNGENLEAVNLCRSILPEAKTTGGELYMHILVELATTLGELGRPHEAYETATDLVTFANANYNRGSPLHSAIMQVYAAACGSVGRIDESKNIFHDTLTTQTRILGRDNPVNQGTRLVMQSAGFLHHEP